jgi:hypothetical protein
MSNESIPGGETRSPRPAEDASGVDDDMADDDPYVIGHPRYHQMFPVRHAVGQNPDNRP